MQKTSHHSCKNPEAGKKKALFSDSLFYPHFDTNEITRDATEVALRSCTGFAFL